MEETKSIKERVREHWGKHKIKYIIGTGFVAVGTTCLFIGKKWGASDTISNSKEMVVKNVLAKEVKIEQTDNSINTVIQNIGRNGHPGVVVYCPELKKVFRSYGEAARETGISKTRISDVANGRTQSVKGLTFEVLGDAKESTLDDVISKK